MTSTNGAQSQVLPRKSVHSIILDTSPILNSTPPISTLLAKCEKLYTVSAVIDEVKDFNARSRLEFMIQPFLTIRDPKPESIKFVSDFSRKTGDYVVLSKPDIQVLALAYELECEQNGGDWSLRKAPGQKRLSGSSPKPNDTAIEGSDNRTIPLSDSWTSFATEESHVPTEPSVGTKNALQPPTPNYPPEVNAKKITAALEGLQIAESDPTKSNLESNHGESLDSSISNVADVESESDDSDGWITPSNLKKQQARDENTSMVPLPRDQVMQVATITGDFAMQNVLLQIGLSLLSFSLQSVKNIRTYILRCHACFEKVKDMSKQFCPRCAHQYIGKPTLTRVSCSTNQKGEFKIHLKKQMQWNHRGDRFSIPKPVSGAANGKTGQGRGGGKGGWGQELILAEDQEYLRATSGRTGKKKKDLMDDNYLPGIMTGERARNGSRPKIGAGRNVNSKRRAG